ncbi:MAG: LysM peptidoglycan-binding domain-containing protein, partial [Clostridia bacterium]|nr:LysM peptidoglycan-binding domain-containing protein [Clostridia bacterium]
YHTVAQGETLWGIAQKYGAALNEVIGLNPQMKNPNLIVAGERVRVR